MSLDVLLRIVSVLAGDSFETAFTWLDIEFFKAALIMVDVPFHQVDIFVMSHRQGAVHLLILTLLCSELNNSSKSHISFHK